MFDVITIGTATRDVFLTSPLFKVLRDPKHLENLGFKTGEAEYFALGSKIEIDKPVHATGGGAANAAVTFSRQGLRTAAVVKIGDDELGDAIIRELKSERITSFAARDKKVGTAYSTILLTPGGERTILVYRGASEDFQRKELSFNKLRARWVYVAPGKIPLALMEELISYLRKKDISIAMNPSKFYVSLGIAKLKDILNKLQVVILNREEAAYLTGVDYKKERAIFKKFDEVVQGIAVVTDGSRGALVSDGRYLYRAARSKKRSWLIERAPVMLSGQGS